MGPASGSPGAGQPCVQMCREAAPALKQLRGTRLASPCRCNSVDCPDVQLLISMPCL